MSYIQRNEIGMGSNVVFSVLRQVAQDSSLPIEELYDKVAWPLYKKFKIESQSDDEKKVIVAL